MLLSRFSVKVGLEDADWQGEIVLSRCSSPLCLQSDSRNGMVDCSLCLNSY